MSYPLALAITILVEVPVYLVVFRCAGLLPGWRGVVAAIGVNLVTHPLVWLVLTAHPGPAWFAASETAAGLVEAALLWLWARRDGPLLVLASIVANTASILMGTLLSVM